MKAAIYSRKSVFTGRGDSIENQLSICRQYAESLYQHIDEFMIYEDEGFSGGNTNRPQFQRLLKDAKLRKFDVLICYRLDRISRNVADFASTLELLQSNNIAFVSIKEQFDTSTPMGKAMVYIASVFAQLERETIAERVRDNMLELSKSGRWLGGQCPLGFESVQIAYIDSDYNERTLFQLKPIDDELITVKIIYDKYYDSQSVHSVLKYLLSNNIKGKNGGEFAAVSITDILRNPVYVISDKSVFEYLRKRGMQTCGECNGSGILIYNKKTSKYKLRDTSEWIAAVSKHKGLIPAERWLKVQNILDSNAKKVSRRQGTSKRALLSGLLKCAHCGSPMRVSYGRRKNNSSQRVYYYMCTMKANSGKERCSNPNVRGDLLEEQIINSLGHIDLETLFDELRNLTAVSQLKHENTMTRILKNIQSKRNEVSILVDKLSKLSEPFLQELLLQKIDSLVKEINKAELGIKNEEYKADSNCLSTAAAPSLLSELKTLKSFFAFIDSCCGQDEAALRKKFLLESAVSKITIDGKTRNVEIFLKPTGV